ncbi:MAG: terpene cyclase/mutase family protein, partial [Candidatus Bathyarchaeota archaeon]|nr:terpene cyclase/mutase family protein [Candidatus Bathyarchaeota archaeon]
GSLVNETICAFPLDSYSGDLYYTAYAKSNVISTFLAVSLLANLGALDRINVTKTTEWVLSCKAENGAFGPFPNSPLGSPLPSWSRYHSNPFYVDRYGAGIAFTYAALGAMRALGQLVNNTIVEREKIRDYVMACYQEVSDSEVMIRAHPDDRYNTAYVYYTYYGVASLSYLGMLSETEEFVSKAVNYLLNRVQDLHFDNSWPVPAVSRTCGFFWD